VGVTHGCQIVIKHCNYAISIDVHVPAEHVINKFLVTRVEWKPRHLLVTNDTASLCQVVISNLPPTDTIFPSRCH
jgi:hypothetical protein